MRDYLVPGAAIATIIALVWLAVWSFLAWGFDYGPCIKSHQEPRHSDAWVEMRRVDCGKECVYTIPIYHPAEDWIVTICDLYQYPDGCGPQAGYKRKANCR